MEAGHDGLWRAWAGTSDPNYRNPVASQHFSDFIGGPCTDQNRLRYIGFHPPTPVAPSHPPALRLLRSSRFSPGLLSSDTRLYNSVMTKLLAPRDENELMILMSL